MQSRIFRVFAGIIAVLWLSGCVSTPQSREVIGEYKHPSPGSTALTSRVLLDSVPFFPQEAYQCGPAALATVLQAAQVSVTPDALVSQVYVPARQGSLQIEMQAAARRHDRIAHTLPPDLESVLAQVQAGKPVLVMQNLGLSWYPQWHYAVVVGYDLAQEELTLRSGLVRDYRVRLPVFERTWQRAGHWAVVLLAPGELPEDGREDAYVHSVNDFAQSAADTELASAYEAGLRRWPQSRLLGMALANLNYAQGDLKAARALYLHVTQVAPDYAAAHNNLAQTLLDLGEYEAARTHARLAVGLGGSFSATYEKTLDAIEKRIGER